MLRDTQAQYKARLQAMRRGEFDGSRINNV
jgi:hypothetical protein